MTPNNWTVLMNFEGWKEILRTFWPVEREDKAKITIEV